jgi:hypothetical protein
MVERWMKMVRNNNRLSIRKAAKAINRSREYVYDLIRTKKLIAYKIGGTDDHPWLVVDLEELQAAERADSIWTPPDAKGKRRSRKPDVAVLDPAIAGW